MERQGCCIVFSVLILGAKPPLLPTGLRSFGRLYGDHLKAIHIAKHCSDQEDLFDLYYNNSILPSRTQDLFKTGPRKSQECIFDHFSVYCNVDQRSSYHW